MPSSMRFPTRRSKARLRSHMIRSARIGSFPSPTMGSVNRAASALKENPDSAPASSRLSRNSSTPSLRQWPDLTARAFLSRMPLSRRKLLAPSRWLEQVVARSDKARGQAQSCACPIPNRQGGAHRRLRNRDIELMSLRFPNESRSYDPTRRAVRFWGHDSAMEASFFVGEDALTRIQPDTRPDESGFLNAFDSNRDLICAAAAKVYVRGSRGSYDLDAANF